ncbi:MAG: hypothetical protein K2M13_01500 [Muribaculaceae bacterium]|nr:hypothetical protein [Muribaculaceae bacterium]
MKTPIVAIVTFIYSSLYSSLCWAQDINEITVGNKNERPDSIVYNNVTKVTPENSGISLPLIPLPNSIQDFKSLSNVNGNRDLMQDLSFYNPYSVLLGLMIIPLWNSGAFVVSGNTSEMSGLMRKESGNIGLSQSIGNLSIYLGGKANKYGYFNGLHTQYGVKGVIDYQVNPRFSITAFGSYYFGRPPMMRNGMPMLPSMTGYYDLSSFGGTFNYQLNETLGMSVGGKYEQRFGTNRYCFSPIVTPTFKIGKIKIGIPIGEILYDYVKSEIERKRISATHSMIPPKSKCGTVKNARF